MIMSRLMLARRERHRRRDEGKERLYREARRHRQPQVDLERRRGSLGAVVLARAAGAVERGESDLVNRICTVEKSYGQNDSRVWSFK